jgi:hypothetical protein
MARGAEIRRSNYPWFRTRPLPVVLILIAVVLVALVAIFFRLWQGDDAGTSRATRSTTTQGSDATGDADASDESGSSGEDSKNAARFQLATRVHRNNVAGYSFRYPKGWRLRTNSTVSRLTRPDRHFIISFGLGPPGGLPVAYDEFVALLDKTYTNVVVDKVNATKVGGNVGVIVKGRAAGSGGVQVRFLATVLQRPNNQRALGALAATDTDAEFPAAVKEVLSSFKSI